MKAVEVWKLRQATSANPLREPLRMALCRRSDRGLAGARRLRGPAALTVIVAFAGCTSTPLDELDRILVGVDRLSNQQSDELAMLHDLEIRCPPTRRK
jgi:hypothetical protein